MTYPDDMRGEIRGALAGEILYVDLDSGRMWTEPTAKYAKRWIGGQMLNSYLLHKEVSVGTKWSDPENVLIFGAGALVGTLVPAACRLSVETINVFSGGKGSANVGGNLGPDAEIRGL